MRVRTRQEYTKTTTATGAESQRSHVMLFDDYTVVRRTSKSFGLGQVTRIVHKTQDFKRPVSFTDDRSKDIKVYMQMYTEQTSGQYVLTPHIECYTLHDTLSHVNLTFNVTDNVYSLDEEEKKAIDIEINKIFTSKTIKSKSSKNQTTADSGRRTVVVSAEQPGPSGANETRKSKRKRTVIFHEYS